MIDEYAVLWAQWGALQDIRHFREAMKVFGTLRDAWKEVTPGFFAELGMGDEKIRRLFSIRSQLDFEWIVRTMARLQVRLFHLEDADYPAVLKPLEDAPPFLFVQGTIPNNFKALGVVGTRRVTPYGRFMTQRLTADLTRHGFVIVSGLAYGVDSCAHETTLEHNGLTVAVLGTGIDLIYPAGNANLARRIVAGGGAIVSEFPLGTPGQPHHFPQRNRIISGLSAQGVLVVEGGVKSGALITAERAGQHGRPVFAVPCNVSHSFLSGTNGLIRDGAHLTECIEDILTTLKMSTTDFTAPKDYSPDERVLINVIQMGSKSIDELVEETPFDVARLSDMLVDMQLRGMVQEVGYKWVAL